VVEKERTPGLGVAALEVVVGNQVGAGVTVVVG